MFILLYLGLALGFIYQGLAYMGYIPYEILFIKALENNYVLVVISYMLCKYALFIGVFNLFVVGYLIAIVYMKKYEIAELKFLIGSAIIECILLILTIV